MFKRILFAGCAALLLAGCSAQLGQQADLTINNFASITTNDLQAADKNALAQVPPDLAASACYEGMQPVVASIQGSLNNQVGTLGASPTGAILAFQLGRDAVKTGLGAQGSLAPYLDAFNKSCGWLKADIQKDVVKVGISLAPFGIKLPFGL